MATYLILNIVFMIAVLTIFFLLRILSWDRTMTRTLLLLTVLTAIFDSLIIGFGIVDYDASKILGVKVGLAPVEDFMYAFLAVIVVPALWKYLGGTRDTHN